MEQGDGAEEMTMRRRSTTTSGVESLSREERPVCHGIDQIELAIAASPTWRSLQVDDGGGAPLRVPARSNTISLLHSDSLNRLLKKADEMEELERTAEATE
jgi:hypothetical protein